MCTPLSPRMKFQIIYSRAPKTESHTTTFSPKLKLVMQKTSPIAIPASESFDRSPVYYSDSDGSDNESTPSSTPSSIPFGKNRSRKSSSSSKYRYSNTSPKSVSFSPSTEVIEFERYLQTVLEQNEQEKRILKYNATFKGRLARMFGGSLDESCI